MMLMKIEDARGADTARDLRLAWDLYGQWGIGSAALQVAMPWGRSRWYSRLTTS